MSDKTKLQQDEMLKQNSADGSTVFGIAKVMGRNDGDNNGGVLIHKEFLDPADAGDYEHKPKMETLAVAEPLKIGAGENHGIYYTPEFGDYVIYTELMGKTYILGSINKIGYKYAAENMPPEAQHTETNTKEYLTTHYPDLTARGVHLAAPKRHDSFHPSTFLTRWRKNDILMYNTQKASGLDHGTAKLMEFRSAENQMLQLVDIGNFNVKAGLVGNNNKKYAANRQTDYRDLWEGFNVNTEFWTERTDKPPLTHESQYVKLATNGHPYAEAPHGDTGADLPDLSRGEFRWDDRIAAGGHETSKTYCPVWQTLCSAPGPDRYYEDKPPLAPWAASVPFRFKIKLWIEDTGDPYDPEVQHFNVGHYLTLSNTIYKRRALLSSYKGHQLLFSDVDIDEKVILNSHRGKYIYMEDGMPDLYDAMWFASQKHHMLFVDHMAAPWLIDDKGAERHRLVDPNQFCASSYQLIQTEKYQKIWLADSPLCPRIHIHTTHGHEGLFLDHDMGTVGHSPAANKGKIQFTTGDKLQQITMDEYEGDITIQNHNLGGNGWKPDPQTGTPRSGNIKLYAANDIVLAAKNKFWLRADMGMEVTSEAGMWNQDVVDTNFNCGLAAQGPFTPTVPEEIRPSVLTDIDVTEGTLINKFKPS
jgi:hypothetical protein